MICRVGGTYLWAPEWTACSIKEGGEESGRDKENSQAVPEGKQEGNDLQISGCEKVLTPAVHQESRAWPRKRGEDEVEAFRADYVGVKASCARKG